MTRRPAVIGLGVALTTVLLLSLAWGLQHAALSNPPLLGRSAPQLAIQPFREQFPVSVAGLKGQPVVLNFWASWCGPCVDEEGVLSQGMQAHPDVAFVGADNRDTAAAFQSFEEQHRHPYPAGPIVSGSYQAYGVAGLPATFFIDPQGVVVAYFTGQLSTNLLSHYLQLVTP
ncbi:MAG TPA: TlpA disulfide reductase family protein [Candidatus Dormibacteraeota bacterium]|nr:TlpA disulfide reductase family protein [Candidatus Dormibacteraeota bacterium]